MSGTLSRGMTILTVSMPTTFGSPVSPRSTTRVERSGFTYTAHAVSTITRRVVPGIVLTFAHRHIMRESEFGGYGSARSNYPFAGGLGGAPKDAVRLPRRRMTRGRSL